jgi:hypothetical protein
MMNMSRTAFEAPAEHIYPFKEQRMQNLRIFFMDKFSATI